MTAPAVAAPRTRRRSKDDRALGIAFIIPAGIGVVAFYLWPLVRGIWLSFTEYNLLTPAQFTGLANYQRMVGDSIFWNAVKVTLEYVVINIGVQTIVALVIAVLMQRLTQSTFLRAIVLTPYLVSNVVVAMLWLWILDNTLGISNVIIEHITGNSVNFFSSALAIPTIALIDVWRHMGYTALLLFAGLQSIPNTVYEAGKVDGASEWTMFWKITVPLLRPILALVLIMTMIGSFQVFDTVSVTTQGGPVNATRVLQYYIYDMAFGRFQFGYASAMAVGRFLAWVFMALIVIITILPFYWVLRTALSSNAGIASDPTSILPVDFNLRGFERVFGMQSTEEALADGGSGAAINFWLYLRNSVIVATLVTAGQVFFSAMAAYSFARLRWRGRDAVFSIFLGALMVPSIFTLLPNFVLIKELHLIDTLLGVALPTMFMTPFAVFFLKQFFMNIPRELEEAALLDGASKIRVFFQLILPMAKAPITTLAILTYITAWNDYFWPLLVSYTDSSRVLTVAVAVFKSQAPTTGTDWSGLMAATLVAALPMLLLFAAAAKRIVNSIGFTGIK